MVITHDRLAVTLALWDAAASFQIITSLLTLMLGRWIVRMGKEEYFTFIFCCNKLCYWLIKEYICTHINDEDTLHKGECVGRESIQT
jgi:hypothetical protein